MCTSVCSELLSFHQVGSTKRNTKLMYIIGKTAAKSANSLKPYTNQQVRADSCEGVKQNTTPQEHSKGIYSEASQLKLEKHPANKLPNCATLSNINL